MAFHITQNRTIFIKRLKGPKVYKTTVLYGSLTLTTYFLYEEIKKTRELIDGVYAAPENQKRQQE
jgi:hypothetical protein